MGYMSLYFFLIPVFAAERLILPLHHLAKNQQSQSYQTLAGKTPNV